MLVGELVGAPEVPLADSLRPARRPHWSPLPPTKSSGQRAKDRERRTEAGPKEC